MKTILNKQKILIITLLIVGFASYHALKKEKQPKQESPITQTDTVDFIDSQTWKAIAHDPTSGMLKTNTQQWFKDEEKEVWKELAECGVSKECFNQRAHSYRTSYNRYKPNKAYIHKSLNPHSVELVKKVLKKCDLNPENISFVPLNIKTPIATNDYELKINDTMFKEVSHNAKLYSAAHEAQHIKFKDDSTFCIVENLLDKRCTHEKQKQKALQRLSRFLEARADYYAITKGPEYAQGLIDFMEYMYRRGGENGITSHPLKKTRIALGKKVLKQSAYA